MRLLALCLTLLALLSIGSSQIFNPQPQLGDYGVNYGAGDEGPRSDYDYFDYGQSYAPTYSSPGVDQVYGPFQNFPQRDANVPIFGNVQGNYGLQRNPIPSYFNPGPFNRPVYANIPQNPVYFPRTPYDNYAPSFTTPLGPSLQGIENPFFAPSSPLLPASGSPNIIREESDGKHMAVSETKNSNDTIESVIPPQINPNIDFNYSENSAPDPAVVSGGPNEDNPQNYLPTNVGVQAYNPNFRQFLNLPSSANIPSSVYLSPQSPLGYSTQIVRNNLVPNRSFPYEPADPSVAFPNSPAQLNPTQPNPAGSLLPNDPNQTLGNTPIFNSNQVPSSNPIPNRPPSFYAEGPFSPFPIPPIQLPNDTNQISGNNPVSNAYPNQIQGDDPNRLPPFYPEGPFSPFPPNVPQIPNDPNQISGNNPVLNFNPNQNFGNDANPNQPPQYYSGPSSSSLPSLPSNQLPNDQIFGNPPYPTSPTSAYPDPPSHELPDISLSGSPRSIVGQSRAISPDSSSSSPFGGFASGFQSSPNNLPPLPKVSYEAPGRNVAP